MSNDTLSIELYYLAESLNHKAPTQNVQARLYAIARELQEAPEARPASAAEQDMRAAVHRGLMPSIMTIANALGGDQSAYDALVDNIVREVEAVQIAELSA